jgi:hypothetical protein
VNSRRDIPSSTLIVPDSLRAISIREKRSFRRCRDVIDDSAVMDLVDNSLQKLGREEVCVCDEDGQSSA